ncbi:hypothetical protein BO70DRAFT_5677 [Aspergillus heteromorphus CBS 117.55]|uniref:Uncharacterized protein n=1 Tax=Aspergillus heteromorphus CBS 117.55 TaxID=1448321 RepID=A0A317X3M3_9EURO|nr:uncharacterized protein BO70DRAFT_5677 [Aspergillus heteromorphus CBS 117.55]PWY92222.1 hypothetical protein BO70DRAFT_5677 [Aspergillus heteromorphus CBS 117.55]
MYRDFPRPARIAPLGFPCHADHTSILADSAPLRNMKSLIFSLLRVCLPMFSVDRQQGGKCGVCGVCGPG